MKKTAIIVDDEELARESLKTALAEFADIEILAECANGFEALKMVNDLKPQILFLDIQMPKLSGFDVVELLGKEAPIIVFVTAYDEYALKAFEAHAIDYLLKPVNKKRLTKTIKHIDDSIFYRRGQAIPEALNDYKKHQLPLPRILIHDQGRVQVILAENIIYIQAQDDYVMIQTANGSFMKYERMSRLESLLDPNIFFRVHRSYILNLNYLKKIESFSKDSKTAVLKNGKEIPVSRSGYKLLASLF
jgi:two-component system LytT family response regulator